MRPARIGRQGLFRLGMIGGSNGPALLIVARAARCLARRVRCRSRPRPRKRQVETAFVCPMHPDYTMDVERQLSALRHGPGPRRAFRRARLPSGLPDRAAGRQAGSESDAALQHLPSRNRRADQEIRSRARAAVPPLRHQPGHGVLPAHPPGAAAGWHVVDRRDAAEGGVLQDSLGLPAGRRRGAIPRPAARDARAMPATLRPTARGLSPTPF